MARNSSSAIREDSGQSAASEDPGDEDPPSSSETSWQFATQGGPSSDESDEDSSWYNVYEEPTLREPSEHIPVLGGRKPLVLVVDDNRDNRDFYVEYLLFLGCRVLAASNGLEGLKVARSSLPNLIVVDVSMPVMDGCEMAQHIRAGESTRDIPMLAVTCFGPAWHEAAKASGCAVVVGKPTILGEFESAVLSLLAQSPRGGGGAQAAGA